jgi:hypothetical protein
MHLIHGGAALPRWACMAVFSHLLVFQFSDLGFSFVLSCSLDFSPCVLDTRNPAPKLSISKSHFLDLVTSMLEAQLEGAGPQVGVLVLW